MIITKPDKGIGVLVMDNNDYIRLLNQASINDNSKFIEISTKRPKIRGRPPKFYHPLLKREKDLTAAVKRILPNNIADPLTPKGSRLAHLYGLPKTHKAQLSVSVRPIMSATDTYNFKLAKWLEEKFKPLSLNQHTVTDVFSFANEVSNMSVCENDLLVFYDVTSLFKNVPLEETIQILVTKVFSDNWFNQTYGLNIAKSDLAELLRLVTKDQLFQYDGKLYEQIDGVGMGSP